jgi:predicted dehydrogenase
MTSSELWLVGVGRMGGFYGEALRALGRPFTAIGRGAERVAAFAAATGAETRAGGLDAALAGGPAPAAAIVATPVASLETDCAALIRAGTRRILLEKPGAVDPAGMARLAGVAREAGAAVALAYNRRFMPTVAAARRMIAEDGGVLSFSFEFSDPGRRIAEAGHPATVKDNWLYANGSHVVDLAFHLGGEPAAMTPLVAGTTDWHPRAARFAGAGRTGSGALFSYLAEYDGPGSWGVEVNTAARRLILRPLETLRVQPLGAYAAEPVEVPPEEMGLKPGLPGMIRAFLDGDPEGLLIDIHAHARRSARAIARMLSGEALS